MRLGKDIENAEIFRMMIYMVVDNMSAADTNIIVTFSGRKRPKDNNKQEGEEQKFKEG
ncbi:hypothetical protein RDWZM_005355 [Blomia tropicalis]|uniref:Uncharacterized protein n=1 Tax=Blomia tropicalis TaxID=40697 RepID=A0A9Q0M3U6_BLOTA|nr:hypothetical protein RDWZM_005355 [Blomia tropicalis]